MTINFRLSYFSGEEILGMAKKVMFRISKAKALTVEVRRLT